MITHFKLLAVVLALTLAAGSITAHAGDWGPKACSGTTKAAFAGCLYEGLDDFWVGVGKCKNESQREDSRDCLADARASLREDAQECQEQRDARSDLCDLLGEAPFDPPFEPAIFAAWADIDAGGMWNPWMPLVPGRTLVYESPDETIEVTVTSDIKVVDGVECRVVRDIVKGEDGELIEDTLDWFAQDIYGNVWYCGEATAEYEDGFPVTVDGSFLAGVDGAKAGILMKAAPAVGDVYRQEFDLGNAEDAAEVVSLHGSSAATPQGASCAADCLVTREFTPLSPDDNENKYYKQGIGMILTIDLESGERAELVEIIDNP